jgi:hypothetical protein
MYYLCCYFCNDVPVMMLITTNRSFSREGCHTVYFISEVLSGLKTQYFHIMKLAYALLITSREFPHYFQAH